VKYFSPAKINQSIGQSFNSKKTADKQASVGSRLIIMTVSRARYKSPTVINSPVIDRRRLLTLRKRCIIDSTEALQRGRELHQTFAPLLYICKGKVR